MTMPIPGSEIFSSRLMQPKPRLSSTTMISFWPNITVVAISGCERFSSATPEERLSMSSDQRNLRSVPKSP